MEETIKVLIYIHAFFGGIGLIAGIGSVIVKKGSSIHKKAGKLFSIGMITSSIISLVVSWLPNHENLFLFLIGLFTIYLVLAGNRALTFKPKTKQKAEVIDKVLSGSMFVFSMTMVILGIYGIVYSVSNSVLYLFFGAFGLLMSIKDFSLYKNFQKTKNAWLANHLGRMMGAFIASVTAFIVAGLSIGSLVAWILPSVLGTIYIIYWVRKVKAT